MIRPTLTRETLVQVCELLDLDPERINHVSIQVMDDGGVEITSTTPYKVEVSAPEQAPF